MPEAPCPLARRFMSLARSAPAAPAILSGGGEVLATRATLAEAALELSQSWSNWLEPSDTVLVNLPNSLALVTAVLATRLARARIALVDSTAASREVDLAAVAVGSRRLCAPPDRFASWRALTGSGGLTLSGRNDIEPVRLPSRTALLKMTSGSTGAPRAVAVSVRQLFADSLQILRTMGLSGADITLAAIPLSHSYGIGSCLVPLLMAGTPLVLPASNLPAALAAALANGAVTHFPAVPAMIRALSAWPEPMELPALRVCLSAGAPLAPADAHAFFQATARKVHVFYGSSECGGITYDQSDRPVHEEGAVGTAMWRVAVEVVDESGHTLPPGTIGRVRVRSRAVAEAMLPAVDGEAGPAPGEFLASDLGELDDRGALTLRGRVAELLNVAGRKVHPEEVRRVLTSIPGVRGAAVVGLPDAHRGELVGAVVATASGAALTVHAVLAACRAQLSPHKVPRRVVLVEELPFTPRGKLHKDAVVELLQRVRSER